MSYNRLNSPVDLPPYTKVWETSLLLLLRLVWHRLSICSALRQQKMIFRQRIWWQCFSFKIIFMHCSVCIRSWFRLFKSAQTNCLAMWSICNFKTACNHWQKTVMVTRISWRKSSLFSQFSASDIPANIILHKCLTVHNNAQRLPPTIRPWKHQLSWFLLQPLELSWFSGTIKCAQII